MIHIEKAEKNMIIVALSAAVIGGIIGGCLGGVIGSHFGRNRDYRGFQRMGAYGMMGGGSYRFNERQNGVPSQTGQTGNVEASTTVR